MGYGIGVIRVGHHRFSVVVGERIIEVRLYAPFTEGLSLSCFDKIVRNSVTFLSEISYNMYKRSRVHDINRGCKSRWTNDSMKRHKHIRNLLVIAGFAALSYCGEQIQVVGDRWGYT